MSFQQITSLCNLIFSYLNSSSESNVSSSSTGVTDLPTCVILQIFLKLPINSILRCKCVCTSWYNLISDPYLVTNYHKNPPFTSIVHSEHRTITNPLDHGSFQIIEIGTDGDVMHTPFIPKLPHFPANGIVGIMGSDNGLLCLVKSPRPENESNNNYVTNRDSNYNNQTVCIVNPLSGESTWLPDVTNSEYIRDVIYGFGEYKVIRLVIRYIFEGLGHEIEVFGEVFTLGVDNEWRYFQDSCIPCYLFPCGVALNGSVHWIGDNRRCGVIYAFDVAKERGECFLLPPELGDEPGNVVLALWSDRLCLTDNSSEGQVDVWIMDQYGVAHSWTRVLILKRWIPADMRSSVLIPVATLRNGELLVSSPYSRTLISFDPKTKRCSKLEGSDVEGAYSFLFGFTPSFISLSNFRITNAG